MGEIKSAVELAMEKTKGFHLSREEMNKLKEEEMQSKAHGLVNRFLEVDFHLKEVEKELSKFSPEDRGQIEKLMKEYLAEAIQLERDNELIFQGIAALGQASHSFKGEIQQLVEDYQEQKGKSYVKTEKNLVAKWEKQGISGSAVQAKVEGSPEWENALSGFTPAFEERLRAVKEKLKL